MSQEVTASQTGRSFGASLIRAGRKPRILLVMLAGWTSMAVLAQIFVNSGIFLDIHTMELDGALGGFALSFNAVPLAVLYLYCWRDPEQYRHVFWLALIHQAAMAIGAVYELSIGTFSFESVVILLAGSGLLAVLCFLQVFEPKAPSE
jgi:hypothetical protein